MAGVDSAGLSEVLQNVLASFSVDDRGLLVQVRHSQRHPSPFLPFLFRSLLSRCLPCLSPIPERISNGYTSADAWSLRASARDAAADPPTGDAAPDSARCGPVLGRVAWHGCFLADGGVLARGSDKGRV